MKEIKMSTQTDARVDLSKVDAIVESYQAKRQNLIAILQKVQETFRYLPKKLSPELE
jgi:NADH:ubiquinone oxidoreductase subunit E